MTELDTLKALLDQRGEPYVVNDFGVTWRYGSDPHTATESMDGTLIVTGMTARQAIDATIGRGECHETKREGRGFYGTGYNSWVYELSCGHYFEWRYSSPPRFCPWCGRRIVEVGE